MENLEKKIKEKRLQEIKLEENFLNEKLKERKINKEKYLQENKKLNDESILLTNRLLKLDEEDKIIINDKLKEIDSTIDLKETSVQELKKEMKYELEEIEKKRKDNLKEQISIDSDTLLFKKNVDSKNSEILKFKNKMDKIRYSIESLNTKFLSIHSEIKEKKNKIKNQTFTNVNERHNIIQDSINNLLIKKKIEKEKKNLENKLKLKEEEYDIIIYDRSKKREELEEEYLNELTGDNVIEKMESFKKKINDFDQETKMLLFSNKNLINTLKKKINIGNDIYNLKNYINLKEKNEEKKKISHDIFELILNEKRLSYEKNQLQIDYDFLKNIVNQKEEDLDKYNEKNKNLIRIRQENKEKKDKDTENQEIRIKVSYINSEKSIKNEILNLINRNESLKKDYYTNKKLREEEKTHIKLEQNKLIKRTKDYQLDFEKKDDEYYTEIERIKKRVLYLKRKFNSK